MLPPLSEPIDVTPAGRVGIVTLILLVKALAQFIVRNKVKIRKWLADNTTSDLVALFDQLTTAIDAFYESIQLVDTP